jgi:hypothetical protein
MKIRKDLGESSGYTKRCTISAESLPILMLFDSSRQASPRRLKDMSFDYRALFIYHICMIALFASGGGISLQAKVTIVVGLLCVITLALAWNKRRKGWHRPATKPGDWLKAAGVLVLGAAFLVSASPMFPPATALAFPWYAAGFGILLFGVLSELRVLQGTTDDFLACCNVGKGIASAVNVEANAEPRWKRIARLVFSAIFLLAWLEGVAFFYEFGTAFKNGSRIPTADKTETLADHGRVVYVSASDKQTVSWLEHGMMFGIPAVLGVGFLLQFGLGVEVFSNQGIRGKR